VIAFIPRYSGIFKGEIYTKEVAKIPINISPKSDITVKILLSNMKIPYLRGTQICSEMDET